MDYQLETYTCSINGIIIQISPIKIITGKKVSVSNTHFCWDHWQGSQRAPNHLHNHQNSLYPKTRL